MKMRAGGASCRPDIADDVALLHPATPAHASAELAEMRVSRRDLLVVLDTDIVAITVLAADLFDHAIAGGIDRRPGGGREVHARMHLAEPQDGVTAHAEFRGNARAIDRRAEQRLTDALALPVEVIDDAVARLVAVQLHLLAAERQRRIQDIAVTGRRTLIGEVALVHHLELVARLDVALEVHVVGVSADHRRHDRDRNADAGAGLEQAAVDHGGCRRLAPLQRLIDRCGLVPFAFDAGHRNGALGIRLQLQTHEPPVRTGFLLEQQSDFLADLKPARIEDASQSLDGVMGIDLGNSGTDQEAQQRVATADLDNLAVQVRQRFRLPFFGKGFIQRFRQRGSLLNRSPGIVYRILRRGHLDRMQRGRLIVQIDQCRSCLRRCRCRIDGRSGGMVIRIFPSRGGEIGHAC